MCAVLLAYGSGANAAGNDHDHDRARQALEAGEILPLRVILERVERDYPGQVIDVELERKPEKDRERWVYEIKVLRSGGSLIKLKFDARDGSFVSSKNKDGSPGENPQPHPSGGGR